MQFLKNLEMSIKVSAAIAGVSLFIFFATGKPIAVMLGFGLSCAGLAYKYPRWGIWTLLIYLPFAGTVTYWMGGGHILFNFFKDFFYIPALIALMVWCRRQQQPILIERSLMFPLGVLVGSSLLTFVTVNGMAELANQETAENYLAIGLIGLKVLLGYIPLVFCGYHLLHRQTEFFWLTRLQIVLVLVCCGLALLQYGFLLTGICPSMDRLSGSDLFKASLDYKCFVGGSLVYTPSQGIVRLPGTFVSPWQWAWFLIANTFWIGASMFHDPSRRWRIVSAIAMTILLIATLVSGQGFALFLIPTILGLFGLVFNRKWLAWIGLGLVASLGIVLIRSSHLFGANFNGLLSGWMAFPPHEFIWHQFSVVLGERFSVWGQGLGTATNAARIFGPTTLIETYYPKLLYEIGLIGCLGFLGVVTTLVVVTFKAWRSLQDETLRGYAIALWIFLLFISYNTYYYPLDVDPVAIYYWFFAGILLKLPTLERQNF